MTLLESMLAGLLSLKAEPPDSALGICNNLWRRFPGHEPGDPRPDGYHTLMEESFRTWPKFSGDESYPIPSPHSGNTPHWAYVSAARGDMWTPNHPYGALRLELVDHMIQHFEEQL